LRCLALKWKQKERRRRKETGGSKKNRLSAEEKDVNVWEAGGGGVSAEGVELPVLRAEGEKEARGQRGTSIYGLPLQSRGQKREQRTGGRGRSK